MFSSHEKSKFWSPKNKESLENVKKGSNKLHIFDCGECGHEFSMRIFAVCRGSWCPYCNNQKICSCDSCFEKSLGSHEKSKFYSPKNKLPPHLVFRGSNKKFIFNCDVCDHEFIKKSILSDSEITIHNKQIQMYAEHLRHFKSPVHTLS